MADLNDDRKKEEEEFGGFEPGQDPNDESFLLDKDGEYPAKLPDSFSEEDPVTESETQDTETIDSAEDESEEEKDKQDNSDVEEDEESSGKTEIQSDEVDETDDNTEEELDDEFKKQLQQNIDASKKRREANSSDDDGIEPSGELAIPIGDDADTIVNLSDIDADKPSNYNPEANKKQGKAPVIEEEQEEIGVDESEEKSKKKTPVWLLMLYSSAATFLLTLGAGFLIWWLMTHSTVQSDGDDVQKTEQVTHSDDDHGVDELQNPVSGAESSQIVEVDSLEDEEGNWLDSMEANMDMASKDTVPQFKEDKELFADLEDKIDKNFDQQEPKKKTQPKSNNKKKITSDKKQSDLASNNTNIKKNKSKTKKKVKVDESQFSMPQPKGPAPETGIFTVQIYSSPSKVDAESWLGQLKAKEIPYAMIVEKDIRGKTWYRVRYGKFETKEAARASASELGYSQSWIDRVE